MYNLARAEYGELRRSLEILKSDVDKHLAKAPPQWHHASRIKTEASALQKLQTGRVRDLGSMEDLVGAMIVVPTAGDIETAVHFVSGFFDAAYRRPFDPNVTTKSSSNFQFDDLRIYGCMTPDDTLPAPPYAGRIFEIQIKTFLQHAWAIATHDLIYKNDSVSWARSRVAFQVKALLEHAELSISSIERLEESPVVALTNEIEESQRRLIDFFRASWNADFLPEDLVRLARSVTDLGKRLQLLDSFALVEFYQEAEAYYDGYPLGYGPYEIMVDYASVKLPDKLKKVIRADPLAPKKTFYVALNADILTRLGLREAEAPSAVIV